MMPTNRFDRTSFAGSEDSPPENGSGKGPEAFRRFQLQLEELGEYARLYVAAKKDAMTSSLRRAALWAAAGLVAASIAVTSVITATVLAMLGLAQLIATGLGDRVWAGNLILGGGLLFTLGLGIFLAVYLLQSKFRKQTVQRYESRHQAQRARFGRDVRQRSGTRV